MYPAVSPLPLDIVGTMLLLRTDTPASWVSACLGDFDRFLVDHAACERKASATAMSFVVRYPDRTPLLVPMVELAREELEHFQRVVTLLIDRGIRMGPDEKDPYVVALLERVRHGRDERLLDRLLVGGLVEARGAERFELVGRALEPGDLKSFYVELATSEARHYVLFTDLARQLFDEDLVAARVDELLDIEAGIVDGLEIRPALH